METVQQNGRFTLFSSKFHSNIYSILFVELFSLFLPLFYLYPINIKIIELQGTLVPNRVIGPFMTLSVRNGPIRGLKHGSPE